MLPKCFDNNKIEIYKTHWSITFESIISDILLEVTSLVSGQKKAFRLRAFSKFSSGISV